MARDGLPPPVFASVHPKYKTPHVTTILTGVIVGGFAAVMSIDEMVDLTNIGTLFAFVLVCVGIIILRHKDPGRARPFRVPFGAWLIPTLGAISCIFLMYYLPPASWWRFIGWLMLGMSIYLSYGYVRSTVGQNIGRPFPTFGHRSVHHSSQFNYCRTLRKDDDWCRGGQAHNCGVHQHRDRRTACSSWFTFRIGSHGYEQVTLRG
jgi:amino acid transporter